MTIPLRALRRLFALLFVTAAACSSDGLVAPPDLAFEACERAGGVCQSADVACGADEEPYDGQQVSTCSNAVVLRCCVPRCPGRLEELLGRACRPGAPTCVYPTGPSCGKARCEQFGSTWSYALIVSACDADLGI